MTWTGIAGFALLVGFGLYVLVLLRIALGHCGEKAAVQLDDETSPLPALLAISEFDCEFATIWQTQVPALRMLRSGGERGVSMTSLGTTFRRLSHAYPELCDGSRFEDWIGALERAQVVVHKGEAIQITEKGRFVIDLLESDAIPNCDGVTLLKTLS